MSLAQQGSTEGVYDAPGARWAPQKQISGKFYGTLRYVPYVFLLHNLWRLRKGTRKGTFLQREIEKYFLPSLFH